MTTTHTHALRAYLGFCFAAPNGYVHYTNIQKLKPALTET